MVDFARMAIIRRFCQKQLPFVAPTERLYFIDPAHRVRNSQTGNNLC
jgi:hypothetical protein